MNVAPSVNVHPIKAAFGGQVTEGHVVIPTLTMAAGGIELLLIGSGHHLGIGVDEGDFDP